MKKPKWSVARRLHSIKLLVVDVDGTLTDGNVLNKRFDSQDGLGLVYLDIEKAFISGDDSPIIKERAARLGVNNVILKSYNKLNDLNQLARSLGITPKEICYIGDDLNDLECIKAAGVGVAVKNAVKEVKAEADYITSRAGGYGAVREIVDMIGSGKWKSKL